MKCPKCGGTGYVPTNVFGVNGVIKCDFCDETGVFITNAVEQTNEEWIKQCTTEQLAELLMKIFETRTFCHICPDGGVCDIGYKCKYHEGEVEDFVMWLKQPHREERKK